MYGHHDRLSVLDSVFLQGQGERIGGAAIQARRRLLKSCNANHPADEFNTNLPNQEANTTR